MKVGFYVSAILDGRQAFPAGPFKTHAEALAAVEPTRAGYLSDPRASFAAWGTSRVRRSKKPAPCGCEEPHLLHEYDTEMATKKASGANIPEAQRGTVQVKLRLPPDVAEALDELAARWGLTRSGAVAKLVEEHTDDR